MNGSELYQYILDNTLHELRGTWEVTQDNELKVTGSNVNGSYVVFPNILTNFSIEWDMTILSSGSYINSGISPIILSSYQGSNLEGWNNGSTITNAKFKYFLCNHRNTTNFGSIFVFNNGTAQGSWLNSNYQNTFTVGTKYRYKLERKNGLFNLYQDNVLVSSFVDVTNNMPIYIGWYMWYGGSYDNFQANFIIDNYVVTALSSEITKYVNDNGVSEIWTNTKNYISAQLLGKSNVGHTHVKNDITDFPTIPTKTSDLTNDSGFLTSHQDLSGYVPRSGGAVFTGQEFSRNVNDSTLVFRGGINAWGNGAQLELCGKDYNNAGSWGLASHNGSDYSTFSMSPNGTIYATHGAGQNVAYATPYNWVEVDFFGGDSRDNGSSLQLHGKDFAFNNYLFAGAFTLQARTTFDYQLVGFANGSLTWNGQAIQTVSDQRLKQQIAEIDDKLLDAWEDVELCQFKYNDAVDQKGDNARLHTGYVVQQINKACKEHGVDVSAYGLYCHEEYPQETQEVEIEQADGTKTKETRVIREASEHYSLRYTEVYAVECMYLRRCIARLTARIEELEKGNNTK